MDCMRLNWPPVITIHFLLLPSLICPKVSQPSSAPIPDTAPTPAAPVHSSTPAPASFNAHLLLIMHLFLLPHLLLLLLTLFLLLLLLLLHMLLLLILLYILLMILLLHLILLCLLLPFLILPLLVIHHCTTTSPALLLPYPSTFVWMFPNMALYPQRTLEENGPDKDPWRQSPSCLFLLLKPDLWVGAGNLWWVGLSNKHYVHTFLGIS